ncbi:site-specific integrase [Eubacteriales bacterium OttesenSCG-928-N14]|nr:site-specific integrase [Eubacteriales bacterium OttesenSCG-928-N14]
MKPGTKVTYETQTRSHIKPNIGSVKLHALTPHAVQGFINALETVDGSGRKLSPKTVKNVHGVLHKALEQAKDIGYIYQNPATGTKLPRSVRSDIKPLEYETVASFLEAIKGHRFERLYMVALFTGLRSSEVLGLTWDCVDFEKGTIYVYRQLQRNKGIYSFLSLKNERPRLITPAADVIKALRDQRKQQAEWHLRAGEAWQRRGNTDFIFTDELGNHLADQTVYKHFKRIMKVLGFPQTRLHDLRHTYAVMSLQAGDSVKTVQEHMGHHTAAFTLDMYGHVTEKMRTESAQRMQAYIDNIRK